MSFCQKWISKLQRSINSSQLSQVQISDNIAQDLLSSQPKRKKAAVLIPMCNRHGVPSILFTLRSNSVGTHKG